MSNTSTIIDHGLRFKLGLSVNEYVVLDAIHKHGHKSLGDLSRAFNFSKATVKNIIEKLEKSGYLGKLLLSDSDAMKKMSAKFSRSGCIVCGTDSMIEKHHYPIRRKNGGESVVLLCRKHHIEFHQMTDYGTVFSRLQINFP